MNRKTAIYKSPIFLAHQTGRDHLESSDRLQSIYQELEREEVAAHFVFPDFARASLAAVKLNHSAELIREIAATSAHPAAFLDEDTRVSADSYEAALFAAGSVIDGVDKIFQGKIDNAFCLVRPPGHHAERNQAMGFCLFNNIAIGAKWAMKKLGVERIMIIDWDLHHGNGTQNSFYRNSQVLYCSTHQYPFYPGSGALPELGGGKGAGYTVNIPLSGGHGDVEYARIFNEIYLPLARSFRPQLIMVSCGFDIMANDPVGAMKVTPTGIAYMTRLTVELAEELCNGKLLFTLEGGYDVQNIRHGVLAVLTELHGTRLAPNHPVYLIPEERERLERARVESVFIDQAMDWVRQRWNI